MQAEVSFKKIYEHDMDLLILEEFVSEKSFAKIFLKKVGYADDYFKVEAQHSCSDAHGESDLMLILHYPQGKRALLVEDKIDAPTMEEQSARYYTRGDEGKRQGLYEEFRVLLAAPQQYIAEHANDANANYEYFVSYEEILGYFRRRESVRDAYKAAVVSFALEEKKRGYQVIEDERVSAFWRELRCYCTRQFPQLSMKGNDRARPSASAWPEFSTSLGKVKVIYKAQRGVVDLEFPSYGERRGELQLLLGELPNDMAICQTGRSASVRIENERWKIDFAKPFSEAQTEMGEVLTAVSRLCDLVKTADLKKFY